MGRVWFKKGVFILLLIMTFQSKARAVSLDEATLAGADAGNFVTAPAVDLTGVFVTTITGTFSDALLTGPDQDAYTLYITGGGAFSATTVGSPGFVDTQLFLFDLTTGFPVYANDDDPTLPGPPSNDLLSTLPAFDPLTPVIPGPYLLVVTRFDSDPLGFGGVPLFDPTNPFLTGPLIPGISNLPVGYSFFPVMSDETYIIMLSGVAAAPGPIAAPETGTISLMGVGIASFAVRRRNLWIKTLSSHNRGRE